jgi:hypothetical protein
MPPCPLVSPPPQLALLVKDLGAVLHILGGVCVPFWIFFLPGKRGVQRCDLSKAKPGQQTRVVEGWGMGSGGLRRAASREPWAGRQGAGAGSRLLLRAERRPHGWASGLLLMSCSHHLSSDNS